MTVNFQKRTNDMHRTESDWLSFSPSGSSWNWSVRVVLWDTVMNEKSELQNISVSILKTREKHFALSFSISFNLLSLIVAVSILSSRKTSRVFFQEMVGCRRIQPRGSSFEFLSLTLTTFLLSLAIRYWMAYALFW